ncbi:MAG: hypothetical protein GY937_28655, partial [bacterium]|nr:hypothetical protein [bacterium]
LFCVAITAAEYKVVTEQEISGHDRFDMRTGVEAIYFGDRFLNYEGSTTEAALWLNLAQLGPKDYIPIYIPQQRYKSIDQVLIQLRNGIYTAIDFTTQKLANLRKKNDSIPYFIDLPDNIQIHKSISDEIIIQLNTSVISGVILGDQLKKLFNFATTWLPKRLNRAHRLEAKPELIFFVFDNSDRLLTIFPIKGDHFWHAA